MRVVELRDRIQRMVLNDKCQIWAMKVKISAQIEICIGHLRLEDTDSVFIGIGNKDSETKYLACIFDSPRLNQIVLMSGMISDTKVVDFVTWTKSRRSKVVIPELTTSRREDCFRDFTVCTQKRTVI